MGFLQVISLVGRSYQTTCELIANGCGDCRKRSFMEHPGTGACTSVRGRFTAGKSSSMPMGSGRDGVRGLVFTQLRR